MAQPKKKLWKKKEEYEVERGRSRTRLKNRRVHELYAAHKAGTHVDHFPGCPKCNKILAEATAALEVPPTDPVAGS